MCAGRDMQISNLLNSSVAGRTVIILATDAKGRPHISVKSDCSTFSYV